MSDSDCVIEVAAGKQLSCLSRQFDVIAGCLSGGEIVLEADAFLSKLPVHVNATLAGWL